MGPSFCVYYFVLHARKPVGSHGKPALRGLYCAVMALAGLLARKRRQARGGSCTSCLVRPQRNRPDGDNPFVKLAGVADIRGVTGLQEMKFVATETKEPKHAARSATCSSPLSLSPRLSQKAFAATLLVRFIGS